MSVNTVNVASMQKETANNSKCLRNRQKET